jgi:hypothetical protein
VCRPRPSATTPLKCSADSAGRAQNDCTPRRSAHATLTPRPPGLRAARDGRFKFIDAPRPELYDLETDPFEEPNLYATRSATTTVLARRLDAFDALERVPVSGPRDRVPIEVREPLKALGYIGADARSAGSKPRDPKDYIATYNAMRLASRSVSP